MKERAKSFLIYSTKCVVGTLIILSISHYFTQITYYDRIWSLLSVLLVLSSDGKDSVSVAFTRIKANFLGAGIAFVFISLFPHATNMWILCIILILTLAIGYILKLDAALRSAMCAAIIITMPQSAIPSITTPLERILAVVAGSLLGIGITYIFHFKDNANKIIAKNDQNE